MRLLSLWWLCAFPFVRSQDMAQYPQDTRNDTMLSNFSPDMLSSSPGITTEPTSNTKQSSKLSTLTSPTLFTSASLSRASIETPSLTTSIQNVAQTSELSSVLPSSSLDNYSGTQFSSLTSSSSFGPPTSSTKSSQLSVSSTPLTPSMFTAIPLMSTSSIISSSLSSRSIIEMSISSTTVSNFKVSSSSLNTTSHIASSTSTERSSLHTSSNSSLSHVSSSLSSSITVSSSNTRVFSKSVEPSRIITSIINGETIVSNYYMTITYTPTSTGSHSLRKENSGGLDPKKRKIVIGVVVGIGVPLLLLLLFFIYYVFFRSKETDFFDSDGKLITARQEKPITALKNYMRGKPVAYNNNKELLANEVSISNERDTSYTISDTSNGDLSSNDLSLTGDEDDLIANVMNRNHNHPYANQGGFQNRLNGNSGFHDSTYLEERFSSFDSRAELENTEPKNGSLSNDEIYGADHDNGWSGYRDDASHDSSQPRVLNVRNI